MRITEERLPWLTDGPAGTTPPAGSGATAVPAKGPSRRAMWPWYLLLVVLIAVVAGGAWWLGTRQRAAAPPQLPAEDATAIPLGPGERAQPPADAGAGGAAGGGNAAVGQVISSPFSPPRPATRAPRSEPRSAERESGSGEVGRRVFPADEPALVPPSRTGPIPVVVHHPQPDRGRVVQLGAFPTRAQADQAWRRLTRRYPYLASKPKMVNTVDVRALGGGRRTRMYRLQLGTSSQAQSVVICQQLERAGQSCVVVY